MTRIDTRYLTATAADGHQLRIYRASPTDAPRGTVLIVQEIFGVTAHIRAVADAYASAGYEALAPQVFDRVAQDLLVPYTDVPVGLGHARSIAVSATIADLEAARLCAHDPQNVGLVGFCWGGRIGYIAACRLPLKAAVAYYGGGLPACLNEHPNCPMMFHFGEADQAIPPTDVAAVRAALPHAEIHLYPAGHAFNNSDRASFEPASAAIALDRSIDFLRRHLG
jgi:carboxymethylenebutenolidase